MQKNVVKPKKTKMRKTEVKKTKTKTKKKRFSMKKVLAFISYEMLFLLVTTPFWVFRGPFKTVRDTVVGAIMETRHTYLATIFLSQTEVDNITGKNTSTTSQTDSNSDDVQDSNQIQVANSDTDTSDNITEYTIHETRFDAYILEIKNPKTVKVSMTNKLGKVGQRTSEMAKDNDADAAINGGAFSDYSANGTAHAGTGATPGGVVITNGQAKFLDDSVKAGNKVDITGFTRDGIMVLGQYTYDEMVKMNITEALSFGGPDVVSKLIVNGKAVKKLPVSLNPRTAIGQKKDGTVIMVVVDGRDPIKNGATYKEVQDILLERGAWNASNLDGGSSATMYYNGEVINNPSDWDGERTVATAFYVKD